MVKKHLFFTVIFILLLGTSVCSLKNWNKEDNEEYEMMASEVEDCNEYVLEKYMQPYWEGNVIYNESFMPVKNEEGEIEPISLMYDIGAIVAVKNSRLNKVYEEGTDYVLEEGKLKILETGSIPTIEYDYMYPTVQFAAMNPDNVQHHRTKGYMFFAEGSTFHYIQLAIADELQTRNIKTATGKDEWHASVIERMLKNEKYMGDAPLQKTYTTDFITKT